VAIPARRRKDRTRIRIAAIAREVGWVAPAATIRVSNGTRELVVAVEAVAANRIAIRTANGAADQVVGRAAGMVAAAAPE
jgi:hypothetical protein